MKVVRDPPWEASRCEAIDLQACLKATDTLDLPLHSSLCQDMSGMSKYCKFTVLQTCRHNAQSPGYMCTQQRMIPLLKYNLPLALL